MKTSRRRYLKTAAAGMGSAGLVTSINASDQAEKWDDEAGIVVLGIGAAGLMTSITAHDQGTDVLILEKAP